VTIKPVLYGGIAARLARVPAVVYAISGLGSVFSSTSLRVVALRPIVKALYRFALGHNNSRVIFQNPSDQETIISIGATDRSNCVLVKGSGVNLANFPITPEPAGTPTVVFASRLLRDKGILDFAEAARLLKKRGVQARFLVAGSPDPENPSSLDQRAIENLVSHYNIEYIGHRDNIPDLFLSSNIIVLPSYYGEGLPKVLIEAAACGRAIVTTDHPGCRDAIQPGHSGLIVPTRNPSALANAIQKLIAEPELRSKMGQAGRKIAESEFNIDQVCAIHLSTYRELMAD
jgi:glycosyltransferase involved in cell wall biosynthesis